MANIISSYGTIILHQNQGYMDAKCGVKRDY